MSSRRIELEIQRNRPAIQLWLQRLAEAGHASVEMDNEAAAWLRSLPEDQRSRLEADASRPTLDHKEIDEIVSGPLGELIDRFAGIILATEREESRSREVDEVVSELAELEQLDSKWFREWQAFEESVEAPEPPRD